MKNLIFCCCLLFCCIGNLSAQSDSVILVLEDTLRGQVDSLDIAQTLFYMGERHENLGNYNQAFEKYEKALRIRKKIIGHNHLTVAESYNKIAVIKFRLNECKEALNFNEDALRIRVNKLSEAHIDVAETYNNIGSNYYGLGNHEKALEFYEKALKIYKNKLGKNHINVAKCQGNIGIIYAELYCDYEKALNQYEKALKIFIDSLGERSPIVAMTYINIGLCHHELGDYDISLQYNNKAKEIWVNQFGKTNVNVATACNNIAMGYHLLKDYKRALEYYNRARAIWKIHLGKNSVAVAKAKHNIAEVHRIMGNNEEALKLNKEVIQIRIEKLRENHPLLADTYNNLANIYISLDSIYEALNWYEKSMLIITDNFGEYHPKTALNYYNKARAYYKMRRYKKALILNQKALKIRKDKLANNHPDIIKTYTNIAKTHQALNNHKTADSLWHIVIHQNLKRLNDTYLFLTDNQRLEYAKTFKEVYNAFYSFATKHGSEDTKRLAAYLLLNTKSLASDYSISVRKLINNMDNEEVKTLHNELNTLNRNISQAELMTTEERKEKDLDITAMRDQQESLSRQLLKNETLREKLYKTPVTWQATKDKLKPKEVILDFVRFHEESDSTWMYYAMLTRKGMSAPEFIRVADEKAVAELLQTDSQEYQPNYIQDEEGLKTLYQKIWQPLAPYLKGIKTVHLSPSGLLHRIDFDVLQDENDKYLAEHFEFHYYTTIRDFTDRKHTNFLSKIFKRNQYKNAVLLGDINYKLSSEKEREDTVDLVFRDEINPLPATREEIDVISNIIENRRGLSTRISGSDATENAIQNCTGDKSSHIFHYATHGKYLQALDSLGKQTALQNRLSATGNPLQRSMLLLSGGGDTWTSKEYISRSDKDGILTAYEVTHLDLSNTKLVVLSACNTGLGDIHDTEGVLGLQSAFKLAGVEHVVVSLWKVNDAATKELMIAFYKNLLNKKQDAPTALRKAKAEMRDKGATPDKWAGFILIE